LALAVAVLCRSSFDAADTASGTASTVVAISAKAITMLKKFLKYLFTSLLLPIVVIMLLSFDMNEKQAVTYL
jgi:hypothetical protein